MQCRMVNTLVIKPHGYQVSSTKNMVKNERHRASVLFPKPSNVNH